MTFYDQINQTPKCTIIPRTLKHLIMTWRPIWKISVSVIIFNSLAF